MLKIVLVDDDHLVTQALTTIINAEDDLEVVASAHEASDAVNLYHQFHPDVVLLDIRIGESSGLTAAKEILGSDPNAKILLLTTFSDDEYLEKSLQLGVKGYLIKQNLAAIVPAIHTAALNQTVFSPEIMKKLQSSYTKPTPKIELTQREQEILTLVAQGLNNKEIAEQTFLSSGTVRNYISQLLEKLKLRDRTQLAIFYYQNFKH
ncbi:response regulator transcription factor [Xylocopilactobacillus apicola]|uniref:DNA-binding response regulator n=1 Tax=Xylocopilactobacillus apicola TaxID=2932184 RepID=A0AAU9D025_9LACO|nr:response regulator transcription factor [Xylocopilactobacillus apicola]BDR58041.1 DNA-binding response regulator [Xylocopilactobacillus apicola]